MILCMTTKYILLSQGTPDGKVIYVSATELLERLQEQEKEKSKESEKE